MALRDGFARLAPDGHLAHVLSVLSDRPQLRFNDAKCDPRGRAFAGTLSYDFTPGVAELYRLDAGPVANVVLSALTCSNGLDWSPDEGTMYFIDTPTQQVRAFDYDLETAQMVRPRVVVEIAQKLGAPDGMCVDFDGCLWVAIWGGGVVHRYTPNGRLDTVVRLPTAQVTSCCFGGIQGDRLFVTSAREKMTPEQLSREPLAGVLFVVESNTSGRPPTPWRPL